MARALVTQAEIEEYLSKLTAAAEHHANKLINSIQPLASVVTAAVNENSTNTLRIYERNGRLARTCWITTSKGRFCFSYNQNSGDIEIREKSLRGRILFIVNDFNIQAKIGSIAASLR